MYYIFYQHIRIQTASDGGSQQIEGMQATYPVGWYHRELTEQGISYNLTQCLERYTVSAQYLIFYAVVIAGTLGLGNERGRALGQTIIKNTFGALTELDASSLIPD